MLVEVKLERGWECGWEVWMRGFSLTRSASLACLAAVSVGREAKAVGRRCGGVGVWARGASGGWGGGGMGWVSPA